MQMFARLGARLAVVCVAAILLSSALPTGVARAQAFGATRDCQTLLKCNYAKGGSFRGCISVYTCKTCRFVSAKCSVRGETTCRRLQCGWG